MRQVLAFISFALSAGYPFWVWLTLRFDADTLGFAIILLLAGVLKLFLSYVSPPSKFFPSWLTMALSFIMIAQGLWLLLKGSNIVFQLYPLAISAIFFIVFTSSLFTKISIIERFASIREAVILPEKKRYMRHVTQVWSGFFIINMAISIYTWLAMSLTAWMIYNGLVSYCLMGLLFLSEYTYRYFVLFKNHTATKY